MPRTANHFTLSRQWELLKLLPSRGPGATADELTDRLAGQGYTVTKRTVERDLIDLSAVFGISCNDQSKPYGWYWMKNADNTIQSIELTDAVSLSLAEQVLRHMLPETLLAALNPKFDLARKKLAALDAHPLARLPRKVRYVSDNLDMRPPFIRKGITATIQDALVREQQLKVAYAAFASKPKEMTLNPLALVQRGTVPYLVATIEPHTDVRLLVLQRFEKATILISPANIPGDFCIDTCIAEGLMGFGEPHPIRLKARITETLANYLAETRLSEDQKTTFRKGHWQLQATVQNTWQLHFWILSQGQNITITSPKDLREQIQNELLAASNNYKA